MLVNLKGRENMGWRFRKGTFYASEKKEKNIAKWIGTHQEIE